MNTKNSRYLLSVITIIATMVVLKSEGSETAVKNIDSSQSLQCLKFDGAGDVVNAGNIETFNGAQFLTAEMWVRIDTFSAWRTFFCKFENLGNRIQFQEYSEPGKIAVVVNNSAEVKDINSQAYFYTPAAEVAIGDWFHLAMVFDGTKEESGRLKILINGMERPLQRENSAKGAVPAHLPVTKAPLLLGAEKPNGAYGYKGLMDEVRIWTIARTQEQIRTDMNKTLSGNEDGLALYYPMFADPNAAPGAIARLIDRAPGKHHANLVNFGKESCFIERVEDTPSVQASVLKTPELNPTDLAINWTRGTGSANAVFITDDDTAILTVENNLTYSANGAFGKAPVSNTSKWQCVYNGNDASVHISSLEPKKTYRIAVLDYNGAPGHEVYTSTSQGAQMSITTPPPVKQAQTIQFDTLIPVVMGSAPVPLIATASSDLPVVFSSSDTAIAKIDGLFAKINGSGSVQIIASQAGNDAFEPSTTVTHLLTISQPVVTKTEPKVRSAHSKRKPILFGGIACLGLAALVTVLIVNSDDGTTSAGPEAVDRPPSDPVFAGN
jgi:hypothetical protein